MRPLYASAVLALLHSTVSGASDNGKPLEPCTIRSPTSGAFFDLSRMSIQRPEPDKKHDKDDAIIESWHARGYDYPANFTLNICGAVVEELDDVVGVDKALWRNVSGFYEMRGKTYSIGQQNAEPVFRGRKLVLNYTNGSPCLSTSRTRSILLDVPKKLSSRAINDEDEKEPKKKPMKPDEDEKEPTKRPKKPDHDEEEPNIRRKSTIISFLCEKDGKGAVSFVGADENECTYFFEARSAAACPGFETAKQQLGPGGVFSVIALVAIAVYVVGGCVYQRTVMHQRGWRQLPNYSFWAAIGGFFRDIFIILTSSCARCLPKRQGYSRVSTTPNGRVRGDRDDENRLIDQLDEEWDE